MSQEPKRIKIEVPANLQAAYANFAVIAHTPTEFFLDFAQLLPGLNKSTVHSRIVMSPTHAKMLYLALGENLDRYEAKHGSVNVPPTLADQLFNAIKPPETTEEEPQ